jgi:hypothetical protein
MRIEDLADISEFLHAIGGPEKAGAEFVALIALQGRAATRQRPELLVSRALAIGDAFIAAVKARRE